jgi:hypothetical protein
MSPVSPIATPQDAISRSFLAIRARYSFAEDGGAVSTIALTSGTPIPSGAIILAAYIDVLTVPVGATATISVGVEAAADIQAVAAISGAPWSTVGVKLSSARTFAAAPIKTTVDRNISIAIATAALTAGIFDVIVYFQPLAG